MPNVPEPALSREQWRAVLSGQPHWVILEDVGLESVTATFAHDNDEEGRGIILRDVEPPATLFQAKGVWGLMALCNAALPDPSQITYEDLLTLRQAALFLEEQRDGRLSTKWPENDNPWRALAPALRKLDAKLTALLPPNDIRPG